MKLTVVFGLWLLLFTGLSPVLQASKLVKIKVLDQDYLIIHFKDGDVKFVDDGTSNAAYAGHESDPDNSYVVTYGETLNLSMIAEVGFWTIKSQDDAFYGSKGVSPVAVHRKTRVNGMSYTGYDSDISDHGFDYTQEHFIYLKLPSSMQKGSTYTLEIDEKLGSDVTSTSITFDIFNNVSEAVHVNLVGYLSSSRVKAADLYHFIGDGGNRDYSTFEGNEVFIYNVDSEETHSVGQVRFWMENQTEARWNLTGSDVWTVDFTGFSKPGTYRLVVDGVGSSQDFEIRDDIYRIPYKISIMGYYYMRLGEDRMDMVPVPRRPLWIQDVDPPDTKIIVTDMHPYHPEWSTFSRGDVWDRPEDWVPYIKEGRPTNPNAIGGHSDALDWDRHLSHVVNVYDLLLAYILSDGALDDDDLRIGESGNGIPDILDEARNEVDFWLNLRYRGGYSHGVTNPDSNNHLYQAGNTAMAAWANALNSAMMSYSFQIAGLEDLASAYQDSAVIAYNFADASPDPMLDETVHGIRGIDFKMMAAAYLYNITGDTHYEDIVKNESMISAPNSIIHERGSHNQLWGVAAYLLTNQPVHYPELYENMKSAIIAEAKSHEADFVNKRPSRRGYAPEQAHWQTNQDMHRTILAHAVTDSETEKVDFLDALLLEADWGLGRNPLNKIQMTTATTELADKRSFENIYTSGRDDGSPGLHPGHTPYLNTLSWGGSMVGSNPGSVFDKFYYPEIDSWPHAEKYINTRFIWSHSEFTPRQTMRGKALLYAYLYGLYKSGVYQPTDFVNLFIGTQDRGNTVPAATAPFGMISSGPDNVFEPVVDEYTSRAGYNFAKDSIRQFSMTHVSGWGCHGALDIPVMPTTKTPAISPVYNHEAYASKFSHDNESAYPGFYEVLLDDYNTHVQITATERSAILRFDYPYGEDAHLIFPITNTANGITGAELNIDTEKNQVTGWGTSGGFCWRDPSQHDYTVYFVARFDHPVIGNGVWNQSDIEPGLATAHGDSIGAWISFGNNLENPVEMRIAISFVSVENAIENLEAELNGKTFARVQEETSRKWNDLLSKVELETEDHDMKVSFYTGLYRNLLHPNIFDDVNGQYRGFNDSLYVIPKGHHKYVNFSTWDTYRTTAYLQGLLVPDRSSDMIESLYLDYKQGNPAGLTIWGYFNNETWVMNGHSSIPLIANKYAMGARDIDLKKIKDVMVWTADNKYRNGDEYIRYGYVPDRPGSNYSISQTLEYSIADYGIAQMSLTAGDMENYERFMARSRSVFNMFNEEIGYLQRKDRDGNWIFPFDKADQNGFNEGNSAQYTWNIPHMMHELVERMGGPEVAIPRLDEFTSKILVGWHVSAPHYWAGNQPGFVVPLVYAHAGAHDKTQELIRHVSTTIFKNAPDGLPGDDDLGATSAMNLFFTLGMYPLKPGVPEFYLSGTQFDKVRIRLDNGSEIIAESIGDPFSGPIQSITVNGRSLEEPFLNIENIIEKPGRMVINYHY